MVVSGWRARHGRLHVAGARKVGLPNRGAGAPGKQGCHQIIGYATKWLDIQRFMVRHHDSWWVTQVSSLLGWSSLSKCCLEEWRCSWSMFHIVHVPSWWKVRLHDVPWWLLMLHHGSWCSIIWLMLMRLKVQEAASWHFVIGWKLGLPYYGLIMDGLGPS